MFYRLYKKIIAIIIVRTVTRNVDAWLRSDN